jgi:hypothetical protein
MRSALLSQARHSPSGSFEVPRSIADLATLMGRDSDTFSRWEAGQSLAGEVLLLGCAGLSGGGLGEFNLCRGDRPRGARAGEITFAALMLAAARSSSSPWSSQIRRDPCRANH